MMNKNFELLAPAGSFEILKAVIEAGADAVYVGGSKYGARAYANNFTEEELLEAIDYVHLRGKKLFLTVNTLFKNSELSEELYEYLLPYYERGLDAVIVQDFGVLAYLKGHFKDLPVHASTQMTVTGAEGAKLLKDLGVERIVLARELSIAEMKRIQEEADVELEVFVHGALCYSFSGQCLFSSILGGRSGNRGRCAQPCRLPYTVCDENKKVCKKESYVLSLKDLCGIEYLSQLHDAGVYSLKIEGRMKQASYAAGVVSYYRKYIDLAQQVTKEDMQRLYELGNRCGFTSKYFTDRNDKSMITFDKPSYEKSNDALHQEIAEKYIGKQSQIPVTGTVMIQKGQPLKFYASCNDRDNTASVICVSVSGGEVFEAKNKPLELKDVWERMNKTGGTNFYFAGLEVHLDEGVFVPNGVLNQLRRDVLDALETKLLEKYFRTVDNRAEESSGKIAKNEENAQYEIICSCETITQLHRCLEYGKSSTIYADSQIFNKKNFIDELKNCIEKAHNYHKRIYLRLPAIFRAHTAEFYKENAGELKHLPLDGFVVRNYEEIYFVSTYFPQYRITADYNLYTYNDFAKAAYERCGITYTTIPLELNWKEIKERYNFNSEIVVYGYYPLMTTANCVHKSTAGCDTKSRISYLKDRYGVLFPVKNFCGECYNVIYNSVPAMLFQEMKNMKEMGIYRFRLDFTIENGEEVSNILDLFEGKGRKTDYTKGHYRRGVE